MRNISRTNYPEFAHCLEPHCFALVGDISPGAAFVIRTLDDLVVDIGDVRNETHRQTGPREVAAQYVIDQRGTTMTQMGWPIDRRAT